MEIHNDAKLILACPIKGIIQELPCLRKLIVVLIPELHFVDGETHMVESQLMQALEIVFLDVVLTVIPSHVCLRQPMAEIGTALDAETFFFRGASSQKHHDRQHCAKTDFLHTDILCFSVNIRLVCKITKKSRYKKIICAKKSCKVLKRLILYVFMVKKPRESQQKEPMLPSKEKN